MEFEDAESFFNMMCILDNDTPFLCLVVLWPDDVTDAEKEKAYELITENGLLTEGHIFNLKYNLGDYFIRRSSKDTMTLSVKTNMFAYDCPNPIEPHVRADGELHRCVAKDIDELIEFMDLFHRETGVDQEDLKAYRRKGEEAIKNGSHFLWRNAENLVYQVTQMAKNAGYMPMLYTDADYVASNACYEKIGIPVFK